MGGKPRQFGIDEEHAADRRRPDEEVPVRRRRRGPRLPGHPDPGRRGGRQEHPLHPGPRGAGGAQHRHPAGHGGHRRRARRRVLRRRAGHSTPPTWRPRSTRSWTRSPPRHPDTRLIMESRPLPGRPGRGLRARRALREGVDGRAVRHRGRRHPPPHGGGRHRLVRQAELPRVLLSRRAEDGADVGEPQSWNVTGPLCTPNDSIRKHASLPAIVPGRPDRDRGIRRVRALRVTRSVPQPRLSRPRCWSAVAGRTWCAAATNPRT